MPSNEGWANSIKKWAYQLTVLKVVTYVGDAVIVVRFANGCYAEFVSAEAHEVLRPPRGYSFVESAAFATNFATASSP